MFATPGWCPEQADNYPDLGGTGLSRAIALAAFLFRRDGALINNVAWMRRHLPLVALGDGGSEDTHRQRARALID